jgi:hypothetical protein
MSHPPTWTVTGLLEYFREVDATEDRRFAFILGAGASVQSGIPMAGHLVDRWLRELHAREDHERRPLALWATADILRIPGFVYERAVESYSEVFARRFEHRPDEGFAYLERILHGKDPSFGYSVLAQILAGTRHRVVITTNFDNLVADALAIYTSQLPFVCGHEALAGFVRANPRRPLVVKIHRDLLLAPKNRSDEISALADPLVGSLRTLLAGHTPIVLGYGGNDGSLMGLLRTTLQPGDIPGGVYWTYWAGGGPPGPPVLDVVRRHGGALVPIEGFDELMMQLNHILGYPRMDQRIVKRAEERAQHYRRSFEELFRRFCQPPEPIAAPAPGAVAADEEAQGDVLSFAAPITRSSPMTPAPLERGDVLAAPAASGVDRPAPVEPGEASRPIERPRTFEPTASLPSEAARDASEAPASRTVRSASPTPARAPAPPPSSTPTLTDDEPELDFVAITPMQQLAVPRAALQAAAQALASATPDPADWWLRKLQADREASPVRRIAVYRDALREFPDRPELIHGLARELALTDVRGEARELYARLEQLVPDDPVVHLDLAVLYLRWGAGRTRSAPAAATAWRLARAHPGDTATLAAIALVRGLAARREDGDDTTALRVLKGLLPVQPGPLGRLSHALAGQIQGHLDVPGERLYSRLLQCLLGHDIDTLQAIDRWNELTPLAPEAAWPEEVST